MNCPRCARATDPREVGDVTVPTCPECGGMFLHRGEMNKIAGPTSGDLEFSTVHEDSRGHEDPFAPIACPECGNDPMRKVDFVVHTDIVLDYCDGCGGFWLDGHELERIREEVRELNEASEDSHEPPMLWFVRFIWSLPR